MSLDTLKIIKDAKATGQTFKVTTGRTPTFQATNTYYISGDTAVVHQWAQDLYGIQSWNRYRVVAIAEARKMYRKDREKARRCA